MDKIDRKILYYLDVDGRCTYTSIAKSILRSKVFVKNRIEMLQNKGVLAGFTTIIDISQLGFLTFDVFLALKLGQIDDQIVAYLKNEAMVNCAIKVSGKYHLYFSIIAKNIYEFEDIYARFLERLRCLFPTQCFDSRMLKIIRNRRSSLFHGWNL